MLIPGSYFSFRLLALRIPKWLYCQSEFFMICSFESHFLKPITILSVVVEMKQFRQEEGRSMGEA